MQHIGGLRTALFNYLLARSSVNSGQGTVDSVRSGSKTSTSADSNVHSDIPDRKLPPTPYPLPPNIPTAYILRLEDTDRSRYGAEFVQDIYDTFDWLDFHWDEGPDVGGACAPYIQSERFDLYKKYAAELVEKGAAYYCFCTTERLDAVRKEQGNAHAAHASHSSASGYDRLCRAIDPETAARRAGQEPHIIRLKIPLGEEARFTDALLGEIVWKTDDINPDPVLLKSDGFPTYHLANIVDDHLMGVTHVLRAQEWLASTPLHILLYKAFGWEPPVFCHLPMVMGQDGKKLSKRHGATSVGEFRKAGYLPQALVNYVALLGASYEEGKDIYTLDELAARFSLSKLNKAPAVFDYKRLDWFNAQYIRAMTDEALAAAALPFAIDAGLFAANASIKSTPTAVPPSPVQRALFTGAMPLVRERAVHLTEIAPKLRYIFAEPAVPPLNEFIPRKSTREAALEYLTLCRPLIPELAKLDDTAAEELAKSIAAERAIKIGDLLTPLRAALTGSCVSPPLFGSIRLLGKETCLRRIDRALTALRQRW
jgi:glutamyl-tRNA synthetase